MTSEEHLSFYGPGPVFAAVAFGSTVACLLLTPHVALGWAWRAVGIAVVLLSVALWAWAVFGVRVDDAIARNELLTSGPYALARNPIYSAIMFGCAGACLAFGRPWGLLLFPAHWVLLTVMVDHTEERWLTDLYGETYTAYCARVWRCVPRLMRREVDGVRDARFPMLVRFGIADTPWLVAALVSDVGWFAYVVATVDVVRTVGGLDGWEVVTCVASAAYQLLGVGVLISQRMEDQRFGADGRTMSRATFACTFGLTCGAAAVGLVGALALLANGVAGVVLPVVLVVSAVVCVVGAVPIMLSARRA